MEAALVADLYSSRGMFVSQLRDIKTQNMRYLTAITTSVDSSVCCLQLQPPLEDSIHPPVLLRNCISE